MKRRVLILALLLLPGLGGCRAIAKFAGAVAIEALSAEFSDCHQVRPGVCDCRRHR